MNISKKRHDELLEIEEKSKDKNALDLNYKKTIENMGNRIDEVVKERDIALTNNNDLALKLRTRDNELKEAHEANNLLRNTIVKLAIKL